MRARRAPGLILSIFPGKTAVPYKGKNSPWVALFHSHKWESDSPSPEEALYPYLSLKTALDGSTSNSSMAGTPKDSLQRETAPHPRAQTHALQFASPPRSRRASQGALHLDLSLRPQEPLDPAETSGRLYSASYGERENQEQKGVGGAGSPARRARPPSAFLSPRG